MKIAFFSLLLLAAKATQTAAAARGIVKVQNEDNKSVRALIGENTDEDGVGPSVIGGTTLDRGVWEQSRRYLVDIKYTFEDELYHLCGATKISDRVVLTAAHCFTVGRNDDGTTPPNFGDFDPSTEIQFNRYAQDDDTGVITIELCQTEGRFGCEDDIANGRAYVVRHPDYVAATLQNDIALIILPEDLDLPEEDEQQVANLPNVVLNCDPKVPVDGQELEVFGWGLTCEPADPPCPDGESPNYVQTGKLEYLTNEECKTLITITDDMLCAKTDSTSGVAVGGGDSGGPLVNKFNVQVGVVSFGYAVKGKVTHPNLPDGFARVSFFCDWIENQVCADVPNDQVFCRVTPQPTSRPTSKASKQTKPAKASKKTEQATAATQADPQGLTANAISSSTNSTNLTSLPTSQPTSNQTMKVKVFN